MFKIEKNVPIPSDGRRGGWGKYPFAEMEVGDSFAVPFGDGEPERIRNRVFGSITNITKRHLAGRKFSTRISRDESVIRVWRVA